MTIVAAFYAGKTVQMMVATAPGGGVDLIGRLVARHLQNHIPGKPTIVVQNMPGAGGMQMANNLFDSGARDGTVIGAPLNGMPTGPLLQPKVARFDPTQFTWIGSMYRSNNVAYVWHTSPVQSLEDLKTKEAIIGTSGPGSGSYDLSILAREVLGLKYQDRARLQERLRDQHRHGARRDPCPDRRLGQHQGAAAGWVRDKIITIIGHFSLEDPPDLRPFARIVDLAADRSRPPGAAPGAGAAEPTAVRISCRPACRRRASRRCAAPSMRPCAIPRSLRRPAAMKVDVDPMTGEAVQALVEQVHRTYARGGGRTGAQIDGSAVTGRE